MKLYLVANARMPNKKGYGIQIAKMCEAFVEEGIELELLVPKTKASSSFSMRTFYKLRVDVEVTTLAGLDWYAGGWFGFILSSIVFMLSSAWYLRKLHSQNTAIYWIDMDRFSFVSLLFAPIPYLVEVDQLPAVPLLGATVLQKAQKVVAINPEIQRDIEQNAKLKPENILSLPNGVDADFFLERNKAQVRDSLKLPMHVPIVLYAGRFYPWKGLEILPMALREIPDVQCFVVGGSEEEFTQCARAGSLPPNMHVVGEKDHAEIALWQAAADGLIILGTRSNTLSLRYTAPMKVYEYMASNRPIIASKTPALQSLVSDREVFWYEPDNPSSLADTIREALRNKDAAREKSSSAMKMARNHTWKTRAAAIIELVKMS